MGAKERRERDRAETRQLILDAARELFVRDGVEAVTMREIAKRIEYTPTAIYHHFRDKHALLSELCAQDFRRLAHAFQRIGRIEDPVERILRIGQAYIQFGLENPSHYRFLFMTAQPHDVPATVDIERGNPEEDAYAFLREAVEEALAAGRFRQEFGDAEALSQVLWAGVHGIVSLHLTHQRPDDEWIHWRDARTTGDIMVVALLRGLLRQR